MMDNNLRDDLSGFAIVFKDDGSNSPLFEELSEAVNHNDVKSISNTSLNLEAIAIFKKTPMVLLIDKFISVVRNRYSNKAVNLSTKLVAFVLFSVVDPSFFTTAKRLKIIDGDFFKSIESLFQRDKFGRKFITSEDVSKALESEGAQEEVLEELTKEKLLIVENRNYYVNDEFVLLGAKICND